jgi:hypothetical protein
MQETYLHHGVVTVYNRRENADSVALTQVSSGQGTIEIVPSAWSGNPSARRDGVVIRFVCENCDETSELTIAQHKGQTLLGWRVAVKQQVS